MKVIMLDVDGVLNGYNTRQTKFGFTFIDDTMVGRLKQIVDATGAKIVLTSTWRMCDGLPKEQPLYHALTEKLAEFGLTIMDKTPVGSTIRGAEIDIWLHKHPECDNFIILDDDNDMQPHGRRLIQTGMMNGLEDKHVAKAIKMLNTPLKRYW